MRLDRTIHRCTQSFSTRFCRLISLAAHALSAMSTLLHTRYPHERQQLTRRVTIARRFRHFYVASPRQTSRRFTSEITAAANHVHLISCNPPVGTLERAPATSLGTPSQGDNWEGFWGGDERYYTRCRRADGSEQWFRIDDDAPVSARRGREADVIVLHASRPLPKLKVGRYRGRAMLIGTRRRRPGGNR